MLYLSNICGLFDISRSVFKLIILYFSSITDVLSKEVIEGMKNIIKLVKSNFNNAKFFNLCRLRVFFFLQRNRLNMNTI